MHVPPPPAALAQLIREADALHPLPPLTVLDKNLTAASGDKHDFYGIGKLAWPNPATPDGLPWIRRDGPRNPAAAGSDYDKNHYNTTLRRIHTLALVWHHTRDPRPAAKATQLIRAWFTAPATRMNPNFQYAAALPGVHGGMPIGIIEGVVLIDLIDDLTLLETSPALAPADSAALRQWFTDYATWLLQSDFGKTEAAATNNHAIWYAAQVATLSTYAGHPENIPPMLALARRCLATSQATDGHFPQELSRRQSHLYSVYILNAYATLARLDPTLWHYKIEKTASQPNLHRALAWILPYLTGSGTKPWPAPDIDLDAGKPMDPRALPLLRAAATAYPDLALQCEKAVAHILSQHPTPIQILWHLTPPPTTVQPSPASRKIKN